MNTAGLRTLLAHLLGEPHHRSHLEPLEGPVEQRVGVEVHLTPVGCLDEAVDLVREVPRDPAGRGVVVLLGHAPRLAHVLLELALRGVEGVANGDVDILVGMVVLRLAIHDDHPPRHRHLDPHVEQATLVVVAMRRLRRAPGIP